MSWRRHGVFFAAVSLACLSLSIENLQATVDVTTSADGPGTCSVGSCTTLRAAIDSVNSSSSTSPISLLPTVNPVVTSTMDTSTASVQIISSDGTSRTITGGGNYVLSAGTSAIVNVSSNISFVTAGLLIPGGTMQLNGPLGGVTDIQLSLASPVLQFSTLVSGTLASTIELQGTASNTITVDSAIVVTATGVISGSTLTKSGAGTLVLSNANNSYSGTNLSSGILEVAFNTALGPSALTFTGAGTLLLDTGLFVANAINLQSSGTFQVPGIATLSGIISGNGTLILTGGGVLSLDGANTYSGATTISSGTLALVGNGSIVNSNGVSVLGTLDISGTTAGTTISTLSGTGSVVLGAQTLSVKQTTSNLFSGVISGTGGLTLASTSTNSLILSGVNTYSGETNIQAGTLSISGTGSIALSSSVNVVGTLDISLATAVVNIQTLSGSGTISLGPQTLNINQQASGTFSGVITGTLGNLSLAGASTSTLTLSGVNTYTGSTVIGGGTLALVGSGSIAQSSSVLVNGTFDVSGATTSGVFINTLAGSGNVALGSQMLEVTQLSAGVFSGVISGSSGSLVLTSSSTNTLTLSGINTYTGSTVIGAGTLALAGLGSIAISSSVTVSGIFDISGTIAGAAIQDLSGTGSIVLGSETLTITQNDPGSFSGVISGGGGITLAPMSSNYLILSAVNTYTGDTLISGGNLILQGVASIASSSDVYVDGVLNIINILGSSTTIQNFSGGGYVLLGTKNLLINQTVDGAFSGMILGITGGIQKLGSATLFLTGNNSYTGVTTITAGTLEAAAISLPSNVVNNAVLTFNQGVAGVYSYVISGSGVVNKTGDALLVLAGNNTYTGDTSVLQGTLGVRGSIASSNVIVSAGATLEGNGSVGSVDAYGTVSPGITEGVLSIQGNAVFETGSTLGVTVDSNGVSGLVVSGSVMIDSGSVFAIEAQAGFLNAISAPHVVVEASSITGQFSSVVSDSAFLTGSLVYSGDTIILFLQTVPLTELGFTGNSEAVAEALYTVALSGNDAVNGIIAGLYPLSLSQTSSALNQMHPALYKGISIVQENNIVRMQDVLSTRMRQELDGVRCAQLSHQEQSPCSLAKKTIHVWAESFGDNLHQKSNTYALSPQFGYQGNTAGVVVGLDGRFATYCYLGGLGGYTGSSIDFVEGRGSGQIQSAYGGLYFSVLGELFYMNASAVGCWSNFHGKRHIVYPGVKETAYQDHGGQQLLSHIDTGVNFNIKGWTIRPFDSLDYVVGKEKGFLETGAGAYDLLVQPGNTILLRNELGLQFGDCFCVNGYKWTLSPSLSWVREMRIKGEDYTSVFIDTNVPFTVVGYFPDRNLFSPGFTVSGMMWEDHLTFNLYYKGEFGDGYSDHSYGGGLRFQF